MMNGLYKKFLLPMLLAVVFISGCKEDDEAPVLSVSGPDIEIPAGGGAPRISISELGGISEVTISCNAKWRISNSAAWLGMSQASGESGTHTVELNAESNTTGTTRTATLTVSSDNGQSRRLIVSQISQLYPSYNLSPQPPDATGMSSTAVELAAKMSMGMGINIGNTMETPNEGDWQNGNKVTESYIKFLKATGFKAIRIPCAYNWGHLSDPAKAKIDPAWLNRVKEVVGWCVDNDMYVMLNIHWDKGWLENNITLEKKDSVNAKQKAFWEQIATTLRDFDEHVLFASANEPWCWDAEIMAILNSYHETFIKAVRATGGRNSNRVLVVQGPSGSSEYTSKLMTTLPHDPVPNKLMVEVHFYSPYPFIMGQDLPDVLAAYYWGAGNHSTIEPERNATFGEEDAVIAELGMMKKFVDRGIPVILGEYGDYRRTAETNTGTPKDPEMHKKSVEYWLTFSTKTMRANGLLPFWWEVGQVFDRKNNVVKDQDMLDAIIAGYK
ncbi:cellulase family glycosylhydrolase [Ohtaekwangia koreensis]|uniref:Aryl-phospho-beta-D-glucosidase BglC, GH1 family n=1 Tax=Ohtaekwangia koreensis TaxID=688867 RepID=A0A1T5KJ00_9BACT|nr:cellulase family glycosylhydrolase [Ohtaekwangia koreensis]SKC63724.1 Aryl-phospho-beta-D-glucosidase BglC, GH1 family [Ohtaekwangia koreensis]